MKQSTIKNLNNESGFTLIELIMVIVILGLLAAVAIPKYVDLKDDASKAATEGVAAALGSASAINKAVSPLVPIRYTPIDKCTDMDSLLADGALPSGYSVGPGGVMAAATATCTVTGENSTTASFVGHKITP